MQPDTTTLALGRYQLLARLASGGMGFVHVARARGEHGFTRIVAVKQLHEHLAEDAEVVARFLAEAKIASQIVHPHVVSVLDVGSESGRAFLVLDYVHGDSLANLLRAASELGDAPPLPVVAAIMIDALEGLHAAHETVDARGAPLGLVHRDVSPHNILVSVRGAAYVTDFGVAKVKDALRQTRSGSLVGKAGYMAPEQLGVGAGVTRATDLYGAGVVLWEAITGARLFDGLEQQIDAAVKQRSAPPPSTKRPGIPPALDALVSSMLALSPEARPRSALEAARALTAIVPPASAREVAEWVLDLAGPKLDRLDAVMREAPESAPLAAGPSDEGAPLPSELAKTIAQPMVFAPGATGTATRWRKRAQLSITAAVVAVLLAIGASGTAIWAATHKTASATPSATPAAPSAAEATDAPNPAASPAPIPEAADAGVVATAPSARPSPGPRPRTRAVSPRPECTPPYVVENGIKRYKRECFAQGVAR